ncbi:MAG: hypothetical protein ACJ788_14865, partial [Ktedonobacteraceae bacterium]
YPEFLKLRCDGDESARRAASSPSHLCFVLMAAAKPLPSTQNRHGVGGAKAPIGRLGTANSMPVLC